MKAILLSAYGGPEKLELREAPEPKPGAGQIKVKVASASLNPIDWKLRSGAVKNRMPLELPAILGRDAAGEVTEVGSGVTGFKVGDRVMGFVNAAYAEFVVAPVESWAPLHDGLTTDEAGAVPLVVLTGDQLAQGALSGDVSSAGGKTVLVTGAIGGVGRTAVWVAKSHGARVLAGVRTKQAKEAETIGADGVVLLDDPKSLEKLEPLDAIADTVGGDTLAKLLPKVKPGGTVASVVGEPAGAKEKGLKAVAVFAHPDAKRLEQLGDDVAHRKLTIPIAKRFPLAEAAAAHTLAEKGGIGKVLLKP